MATLSSNGLMNRVLAIRSSVEGMFLPAAQSVALEVVSGLHAGARLDLADDLDTIGSSTESKIVLKDKGVAPVHARFIPRGSQIELEAVGGEIGLPHGEVVPVGFGRRWTLPVEVSVGEARVRLAATETAGKNTTLFSIGSALIATAILALAANNLSQAETGPSDEIVGTVPAAQEAPANQPMTLAAAEVQLRHRIAESGLSELQLTSENGRLVASGTLAKNQSQAWADIQSWFDQANGARIPLASDVSIGGVPATPRLSMQAIWYGERPYVIATDGARYHEGAFIDGGWRIKQIGETALVIAKDGATIALKYQ